MITPTRTTPSRRKVENYLVARIEKGIEVVLVAIDVSGCKVWSDAPIRELRKALSEIMAAATASKIASLQVWF